MQTRALFLSLILIFSFMFVFVVSSEQANAVCYWSNQNSGKFCNQDSDCPSSYVSGNDCYYKFCDCSKKAGQWRCFYDYKSSSKPDCSTPTKKYGYIYYDGKWYSGDVCYSMGTPACDSSKGWTCNYASIAPLEPEIADPIACNDGKDNDCDGKVDECEPLCETYKNEHDCGMYFKYCKWCGYTSVLKDDPCPPFCLDSDSGKDIYTGGTCYDDSGCKKGCKDSWPPSDYTYTVGEYYCLDGKKCTSENIRCPKGYVVRYTYGKAYCTPPDCLKEEGQSCSNSVECCTGICGDKTSDSCSSANPVCHSSKTGMKWAYDPSSCELGW